MLSLSSLKAIWQNRMVWGTLVAEETAVSREGTYRALEIMDK